MRGIKKLDSDGTRIEPMKLGELRGKFMIETELVQILFDVTEEAKLREILNKRHAEREGAAS